MHTEWIDLDAEIANEKLNNPRRRRCSAQRYADAQPGTIYTANGRMSGFTDRSTDRASRLTPDQVE